MQKSVTPAENAERQLSVGAHIKGLRQARGLSLRRLARETGVSVAALSRWESDLDRPRIPELDVVLRGLEASEAQKKAVLRQMRVPRAIDTLRLLDDTGAFAPLGGDLLWALRQRKHWTQTELARAAGVTQSQIARWEKGDGWPNATVLHKLCWHLEARADEVSALTRYGEPTGSEGVLHDETNHWDEARWTEFIYRLIFQTPSDPTFDLRILVTQQRLMQLAQSDSRRQDFALARLADVYAIQARGSIYRRQEGQAARWAARGLALARRRHFGILPTPDASPAGACWFGNVLAVTTVEGQNKKPAALRYAATLLREWLPTLSPTDVHYSWGQMNLASLMNRLNHHDEGIALGQKACENAEAQVPADIAFRWREFASLLLNAGQPAQALMALEQSTRRWLQGQGQMPADMAARQHLLSAECFIALGDTTGTNDHLRAATRIVTENALSHLQDDLSRAVLSAEKPH